MSASKAIVIGVSAGAVEALSAILPQLPKNYPLPILIVVHLPPQGRNMLVELFQPKCELKVKEAEDKEPIEPGTVYFAPADYHLLVEKNNYLSLSSDEPEMFSRPSIDILFESAAEAFEQAVTGIVLTGANSDGTRGLKAITAAGGVGWVQRPEEAFAPMMPQSALEANPEAQVLSLQQIVKQLKETAL